MLRIVVTSSFLFATACISAPPAAQIGDNGDTPTPDAARHHDTPPPPDVSEAMDGGRDVVAGDAGVTRDFSSGDMSVPDMSTDGDAEVDGIPADAGDTAGDTGLVLGGELTLIVGDQNSLLSAETDLIAFLQGEGFAVTLLNDENAGDAVGAAADIVVMTRSASAGTVGAALKPLAAPLLHWEHAQQWADRLGTVTAASSDGANAMAQQDTVYVDPAAPSDLTCGTSGPLTLYSTTGNDVTFAEPDQLGGGAVTVATLAEDDGRAFYYVYPANSALADGTTAAGARAYFGIDRNKFGDTTTESRDLLRCALAWSLQQQP